MATPGSMMPVVSNVNIGVPMIRTVWALLVLSTVVVLARLYVKARTLRRFYYDDAFMVLALAFGYAHAAMVQKSYQYGLGRHLLTLAEDDMSGAFKYGFFSLSWGFLSPMFGRLSFCTFMFWVAGSDPLIKRWPVYVFMILQFLTNVAAVILNFLQCGTHLSLLWNIGAVDGKALYCKNPIIQTDYGYFFGSFNTLTDLFLTILPALVVWHTRMTIRAKIGLSSLLCLSALAMVASIVKTINAKSMSEGTDYTYDLVPYVIWISIELNIVMLVASIPILRPLFNSAILTRLTNARLQGGQAAPRLTDESVHYKNQNNSQSKASSFKLSKLPKVGSSRLTSMSSEEDIFSASERAARREQEHGHNPFGITRTVEVEVSYAPNDKTWVHAALVGLPTNM